MGFFSRFFNRFAGHTRGTVATTVALSIVPLALCVGGGVDFGNAISARARLQDAADSAAIAAALDPGGTLATEQAAAKTAFQSNLVGTNLTSATGALSVGTVNNVTTMTYTASAQMPTVLLGLAGISSINITALAKSGLTINTAEIAFVLDNTGSMADDNKMTQLKSSLDTVLASLLDSSGNNVGNTKVALVPFDTQVALNNVASMANYAGNFGTVSNVYNCTGMASLQCQGMVANYVDMCNGNSTCLGNNINYTMSYTYGNSNYFSVMSTSYYQSGTSGRNNNPVYTVKYEITTYKVSGTTLTQVSNSSDSTTSSYPTYYSPAYYGFGYGYGYGNYSQYNGTITYAPPSAGGYSSGSTTVIKDNNTITANSDLLGVGTSNWSGCVIDRVQPYDVQSDAPVSSNTDTLYPAAKCATNSLLPIMALTTNIASARSYAKTMTPAGNTNITIGIQWGMEVLSPTAPFTEGAAFNDKTVNKYMIVLTDGLNTQNRWTTSASQIDARTALACTNAKALGITVFTVRLEDGNSSMLSACASNTGYYYNLTNSNQISGALGSIMKSIKKIRLTQ